jgi:hypothetical protein
MNEEEKLYNDYKRYKKLELKNSNLAGECLSNLRKICSHPTTRVIEKYYEGGYLNQSMTVTELYCEVCDSQLDETVKYHGFS